MGILIAAAGLFFRSSLALRILLSFLKPLSCHCLLPFDPSLVNSLSLSLSLCLRPYASFLHPYPLRKENAQLKYVNEALNEEGRQVKTLLALHTEQHKEQPQPQSDPMQIAQ